MEGSRQCEGIGGIEARKAILTNCSVMLSQHSTSVSLSQHQSARAVHTALHAVEPGKDYVRGGYIRIQGNSILFSIPTILLNKRVLANDK